MKLLCLAENEQLGQQICAEAERLSWSALFVRDRKAIGDAMRDYDPDLLLVEVPGLADLDWWKDASVTGQKPVIFVNEELTEEYLSKALDCGADAFLPVPFFSSRHFEARIRSLLRRQQLGQNKRFLPRFELLVDSARYCVEIGGQPLDLTLTEFKILRELASDEPKVISRLEIQTRVFGKATMSNRSLDVHICALRKKIKVRGLDIDSVRGVGYRLSSCST